MRRICDQLLGKDHLARAVDVNGKQIVAYVSRKPYKVSTATAKAKGLQEIARRSRGPFCGVLDDLQLRPRGSTVWLIAIPGVTAPQLADIVGVGVSSEEGVNSPDAIRHIIELYPDGPMARMVKSGLLTIEQLADPQPDGQRQQMRNLFRGIHKRAPFEIIYADRKGCLVCFLDKVSARAPSGSNGKSMR